MMFNVIPAIITVINGHAKKVIKKYCPACKQDKDYGDFDQTFDDVSHICRECADFERDMEIMAEYQAGGFDDDDIMPEQSESYSETLVDMEME